MSVIKRSNYKIQHLSYKIQFFKSQVNKRKPRTSLHLKQKETLSQNLKRNEAIFTIDFKENILTEAGRVELGRDFETNPQHSAGEYVLNTSLRISAMRQLEIRQRSL